MSPEPTERPALRPGTRVRITQHVAARFSEMSASVEGTVVSLGERPTGSWFAHGTADKLWLDRVVIRKADGEISTLNVDDGSHIEVLGEVLGDEPLGDA